MIPLRKNFIPFLSVLFLILFSSCRNMGTAVVLWPPEESRWETGDLISVKDESLLRNTYIVNLPEQRRLKEEIDRWRLKLFRKEKDAVSWAQSMGEWKDVYAECLFAGLPMRIEPSNTANRIYRFREGELIKVIGRIPQPVQVGNLRGYWYNVLASGGVVGYVFDYHLNVFRFKGEEREVLNQRSTDDKFLTHLLSVSWRPKYFENMANTNRIDLGTFNLAYGLFFDTKNKTITLNLPDVSFSEEWTKIIPSGRNRYTFLGTSFRITENSNSFISVQYNDGQREYYEAFVSNLEQSISSIIDQEKKRREDVLTGLLENGPVYSSSSYGKLTFLESGGFTWNGKSSLIARNVLDSGTGNRGKLIFGYFMASSMAASHEGVLNLLFDSGEEIHFLYAFENGALRLLYVPDNFIDDKLVTSDVFLSPVRLFFEPVESSSFR